jgi:hypothetical protein
MLSKMASMEPDRLQEWFPLIPRPGWHGKRRQAGEGTAPGRGHVDINLNEGFTLREQG